MTYMRIYFLMWSICVSASQKVFSVNDDVFAYPQYEIEFSDSYVLEETAAAKLHASISHDVGAPSPGEDESEETYYERLVFYERPYLCSIPHVSAELNETEDKPSEDDRQKELIRAADRGWRLLQDMEDKQCLYYSEGWWSYAFCYNKYVKQFHALPPASGSIRPWPPQEDQTVPSYILGQYEANDPKQTDSDNKQEIAALQTRADGNYLVQRLDSGTPCDLTGKKRKVEVEFHCHPQTTDRIVWIKETATCAYLMVVYTARLCDDVAFQPHRDSQAHTILCHEILTISDAAHRQGHEIDTDAVEQSEDLPLMVGKIEVGAMKYASNDGKKLERGKIVMSPEEKAETIIMQKDGQIESLSRSKMKEMNIDPEEAEAFKKELQKRAGTKDWKIERLGDRNGQIILRGIVSADEEGNEEHYEVQREDEDEGEGSEEELKQKL